MINDRFNLSRLKTFIKRKICISENGKYWTREYNRFPHLPTIKRNSSTTLDSVVLIDWSDDEVRLILLCSSASLLTHMCSYASKSIKSIYGGNDFLGTFEISHHFPYNSGQLFHQDHRRLASSCISRSLPFSVLFSHSLLFMFFNKVSLLPLFFLSLPNTTDPWIGYKKLYLVKRNYVVVLTFMRLLCS